jgi:protein TonB
MSATLSMQEPRAPWGIAGAVALTAHGVLGGLVLLWSRPAELAPPEPVVLVELPPADAPAPAAAVPEPAVTPPLARVPPRTVEPPVDAPRVSAPLPRDPVTLPPPPPQPVDEPVETSAESALLRISEPAPEAVPDRGATSAKDPQAERQVADYFARLSAHLNRRKSYPATAKKARQQGVVTVRFTVDRDGNVSGASIKKSSGHDILDQATLELLQRVAPLPRLPDSMQRDSLTLSLPIDYSLRTH